MTKECKNTKRKTYTGRENTPLGRGYHASAEKIGSVMQGRDRKKYKVIKTKSGKRWQAINKKISQSPRKIKSPRGNLFEQEYYVVRPMISRQGFQDGNPIIELRGYKVVKVYIEKEQAIKKAGELMGEDEWVSPGSPANQYGVIGPLRKGTYKVSQIIKNKSLKVTKVAPIAPERAGEKFYWSPNPPTFDKIKDEGGPLDYGTPDYAEEPPVYLYPENLPGYNIGQYETFLENERRRSQAGISPTYSRI